MSDNILLNTGTGGATLATDEIAGPRHAQFVKLMDGTADSAAVIPGDATNGLDVDPTRFPIDRTSSGTITAAAQTVAINKESGEGVVGIQITGTWTATIEFEGTVDGTNWVALRVHDGTQIVTNTTVNGLFVAPAGHLDQVRIRSSAYTSGTANINLLSCRGVAASVVTAALPAGTNNIGDVDVLTLPALAAGTNNIGDVDVLTLPALPAGTNNIGDVDVLTLPALPAGTNNIGDVDVLTMPNVTLAAGTNTNEVVGDAAHDAPVAGNPLRIGAKGNTNEPTAVSADGDTVDLWADLLGRLVVLPGHPNPEPPVTANGSAAGVSVIAAPGVGLSLYICKGSVHQSAAAEQIVSLRDGAAGTIRWTANLAADGGGSIFDFGARGWKLTANTAFVMDAAAATAYCNVTEYYIAP